MGLFNRKPKTDRNRCDIPYHQHNETPIVPECPGCKEQRIAAGKTISEWYDGDIIWR